MIRSRLTAIRLLLVVFLTTIVIGVLYELSLPGRYINQSEESVISRIEMLANSTDVVADGWINSGKDSNEYLRNVWQIETPAEWYEKGVSLYLARGNDILFWANNTFGDPLSDSIILSDNYSFATIDSSKVLILTKATGDLKAITVIELSSKEEQCNSSIFDDAKLRIVPCESALNASPSVKHYSVLGKSLCIVSPLVERHNFWISFIGWFGLFAGLVAATIYLSSHTKSRYVWRNVTIFGLSLIVLRVGLNYVDFPQGASYSWSSLSSILVSQLILLLFVIYLYSVRQRFARYVSRMSRVGQWVMLIGFTLVMSATIIYFHYMMVQTIFRSTIMVEIYNIFSMSAKSFEFYCICAVFAAYRILYSLFARVVFPQFKVSTRVLFSVITLALMVIPIYENLHQTVYFLLFFHILFVILSSRNSSTRENRIFVIDIVVLSLYISLLTASESSEAKVKDARQYAKELSRGELNVGASYFDFVYSIISTREVKLNKGSTIDIGRMMPYSNYKHAAVERKDGYIHVIEPMADSTVVVVSYPWVSILDITALVCYIFFGLYVVAGFILRLAGVDVYDTRANKTMAYRIQFVVTGIVVFSLIVVAWVVYQYSDVIYRVRQRELLNSSASGVVESLTKYCKDQHYSTDMRVVSHDSIIMDWYDNQGNNFKAQVTLYNARGCRIGGNNASVDPYRLNQDAYRSLSCQSAPYFDNYQNNQSFVYISLFIDQTKVGYFMLSDSDVVNRYDRYWLLGSIFNVFIILLFVSLLLSIVIYSFVAGPIKTLTHFLGGVGKLQKIPVKEGHDMTDEVGQFILQYNRMIDYLEESYVALSKFEREAAWKDMARQVAHEIKNPLTPMRLKIQMLQRARAQGDNNICTQLDSTLAVLLEQIDVLAKISTDFSDLARLEDSSSSLMELNPIVSNIVTLYTNNIQQVDIRFIDTTESSVWVSAPYVPLSRLLVNLLQNASQAIECNGMIVVTLSQLNSMAKIDITDNGRGIEPELLERIFEPNFTTRPNGSGLGLPMCRQIVESFNGTISVASTLCVGSTFTVTLPMAQKSF